MTEQTSPSRRAGLRDEIAAAIWERQNPGRRYADCEHPWQADAEADADAVLPVLYRAWPWLRAEAEEAALLPAPVDRAAVLRDFLWRLEQSAGDAAAEKFLDDNPDLAALLAAPSAVVVRRATDETQGEADPRPCGECSHPKGAHTEGEDPVSPGRCADCPESGEEWHDYQPAAEMPQPKQDRP